MKNSIVEYKTIQGAYQGASPCASASNVLPHIFITGKAGHGKDSIGDHLIACYGFEKLSFSDGIRKEIYIAYAGAPSPVTLQWQDTREIKEIPQARLALTHCADIDFIQAALLAFAQEDQELFAVNSARMTRYPAPQNLDALSMPSWGAMQDAFHGVKTTFYDEERMMLARSPRRIQQVWGTEYRRSQDPLYWLNYAEQKTDFSRPQVLTSVRYPNELEFGARIDAVRIHVQRPSSVEAHDHITEQVLPMDAKTIVIDNTGSIADLHKKIDAVIARMGIPTSDFSAKRTRTNP